MKRLIGAALATALIAVLLICIAGAALAQWVPAPYSGSSPSQATSPDKNHLLDPENRRAEFERKWFVAKKSDGRMSPQQALAQRQSNPARNNVIGQGAQPAEAPSPSH